ncbi:BlaI/MecI/CopY family transcriptional regulator [Prevotella brunnea]|uniref:BlaI/MecI/CopY family transcriptional regulator n=1 Tax=Prevotella brunnea TaxID=2508867 RepID=A0A5C8G7Z2_9BACT|nr:BlaI/MecI/CopY family transcriptional regulator [Prevotella brunnea]TXJ57927.1 BlaI/MecI/CopY family transcriptional regulator [Prevotella brunnea]
MEELTKQEEEVMLHVWKFKSCTIKQVREVMPEPKPPYTTLASVINKLKRKQFLSAKQEGITYVYAPKVKKSEYKKAYMSKFVDDYFKNSFREMVSFFAKEQKISPKELKDIIKEIEKGKK